MKSCLCALIWRKAGRSPPSMLSITQEGSKQINSIRLAIFTGLFLAIVHAAWATMVAIGWAQPLMNFVFWAHFITPPYHVEPFSMLRAVILVGLVFVVGAILGAVGGFLWNMIANRE